MGMSVGRPKIENPKNRSYRLRMTEDEFEYLTKLSETTGMKKSYVIREGISMFLNHRWHPYPEEIPDSSGMYIVTIDEGEYQYVDEAAYSIFENQFVVESSDGLVYSLSGVIAWIEYPLPYQKKER